VTDVLYTQVKLNRGELGLATACRAIGVSRKWCAIWLKGSPAQVDKTLLNEILDIALMPRYGYRRITAELHNRSYPINHKKVLKIMREQHLTCKIPVKKPRTTNSDHGFKKYPNLVKDLSVTGLNHVWVADITYIRVQYEFFYLAAILDRFSRKCIGWALGRTLEAEHALRALDMALVNRRCLGFVGLIHHSDRGVQYASDEYVGKLTENGIQISMTESGDPRENAHAESFNKTLKYEEVYLSEYESFEDALENIERFIEEVYNKKRLHSSIGYKAPEKFEEEFLSFELLCLN